MSGAPPRLANQTCIRVSVGPLPRWQLRSVEVLSNAIERLKGSPASPGPKRVFRTVVSELARGLTWPCKPVGHANAQADDNAWRCYRIGCAGHSKSKHEYRELAHTFIAKIELVARKNAAGQSNVNTLAVMPLVACATASAAIARCALAQGKTQLAGLPLRILCG